MARQNLPGWGSWLRRHPLHPAKGKALLVLKLVCITLYCLFHGQVTPSRPQNVKNTIVCRSLERGCLILVSVHSSLGTREGARSDASGCNGVANSADDPVARWPSVAFWELALEFGEESGPR